MVPEQIERIKREYTDKYVVVDPQRPELARFKGVVGQVKTVNMSGRALVEFLDFHKNIGWYDIDIDFLKVVEKPAPAEKTAKQRPKPAAKKPVAAQGAAGTKKKLSPLEMARMQGPAKKPAQAPAETKAASGKGAPAAKKGGAKRSVAEILAAARAEKGAGPAAKAPQQPAPDASATKAEAADQKSEPAEKQPAKKQPAKKMSVAEILAAARAEKGGSGGSAAAKADAAGKAEAAGQAEQPEPSQAEPVKPPVDRKKMSVAEILAAARAEKGATGGRASQGDAGEAATTEESAPAAETAQAPQTVADAPETTTVADPPAQKSGKVDRANMSVAEIIAWCREHDG